MERKAYSIGIAAIAVLAAITAGMHMETQEEKERDLVLEEIERKKEPGS